MKQLIFETTAGVPVLPHSRAPTFSVRRFTIEEYHRMGEVGILGEDDRVELIDGNILKMSPVGSQHAACVSLLNRLLRPVEESAIVRIEDPIVLNDETEPQPDIAVVRFKEKLYADAHPRPEDVLLIIEVAETSLEEDREIKLPRYAASSIPEVWIVNLVENLIEVYRDPLALANGTPGYHSRMDVPSGQLVRPGAFAHLEIELSLPIG